MVNDEHQVIVYYAGNFNNISKQYGTVATLQFNSDSQAKEYKSKQDSLMATSTEPNPIVFRSKNSTLYDVFFGESEYGDEAEVFDLYIGLPSRGSKPFMTANLKVVDVPQYEHFDDDEYPEFLSYFMYGDKKDAFLFHIPTKNPDFLQIVKLDGIPKGVGSEGSKDLLLKKGIEVNLPEISGSWPEDHDDVKDPLKNHKYGIKFVGIDGEEVASKVKIERKVWFDGTNLNK